MPRNVTLEKLLDDLRAEIGVSLNPAHNAADKLPQIKLLQRTQETLADEFAWPHMVVERQIPLQAGQRYYDTPEDIAVDKLIRIEVFSDGGWRTLLHGIGAPEYAAWNSDLDERNFPPRRWRIHEDEDIEIWPISDSDGAASTLEGYLKFTGVRKLRPLVDEADRCDLDSRLIVLRAAAEKLARDGAKDAPLKLEQANARLRQVRANLSSGDTVRMYGVGEPRPPRKLFIGQYRAPGS